MAHDQLADQRSRICPTRWRHGPWSSRMASRHFNATFSWIPLPTGVGWDDELTSGKTGRRTG
jgi:hypothetical protein